MRHVASLLCFHAVAALAVGCGARTTLEDDELFGPSSGGSSGGGSDGGTSTSGGAPGTGAYPGSGGFPGTGGSPSGGRPGAGGGGGVSTGGTGTAGMAGTGAVGGSAGSGGSVGGSPGKGDLIGACESLCYPYTEVCPDQEYETPEDCTIDCASGFVGTGTCRKLAVEALNCVGGALEVELPCETALIYAVSSCADAVAALNECGSF